MDKKYPPGFAPPKPRERTRRPEAYEEVYVDNAAMLSAEEVELKRIQANEEEAKERNEFHDDKMPVGFSGMKELKALEARQDEQHFDLDHEDEDE